MAYTQEDYLKALNRMRSNYQNYGNASLVNRMDDSTYVGEELSSFAYMNTPLPSLQEEKVAPKEEKNDRNWLQRIFDTGEEFFANITEGIFNAAESVIDFGAATAGKIGSLFGADDKWAEDFVKYDWSTQANEMSQFFNMFDVFSGDVFKEEYYKDYGKIFVSPDYAQERANKRHQGSFVSEASEDFQKGYYNFTEGLGELLPSVVLGIATGGSSLLAQAGSQGLLSLGKVGGQSTENALNDGANFDDAYNYGLVKGGQAGLMTTATVGIGGTVVAKSGQGLVSKLSGKLGEKISHLFSNSATAEVVASKSLEILSRAGIDATSAAAQQLVDPLIKQITYDDEAFEKAYGSSEAAKETWNSAMSASLQAGITSAILGTAREVVSGVGAGSFDKYKENYFVNKLTSKDRNIAAEYEKEYSKLQKQYYKKIGLKNGYTVSEEEFIKISNEYSNKILALEKKYKINEVLKRVSDGNTYEGTTAEKYAHAIGKTKNQIEDSIASRQSHAEEKAMVLNFMKSKGYEFKKDSNGKWSAEKKTSQANNSKKYDAYYDFSSDDNVYTNGSVRIAYNEKNGEATLTTPYNPSSPINIIPYKNTLTISLKEPHQVAAVMEAMKHGNQARLPDSFTYNDKTRALSLENLSVAKRELENKNNDLYGLKDGESALKYLNNNYTKDEIRHLNNSKSQLITTDKELKKYIYDVFNNYENVKKLAIIGRITNKTSTKLKNDTGKDFSDFSLAYNKSYLKHIERDHILNTGENLPLSYVDLLKFPYIMENYDTATIGDNGKLILTKWINDQYKIVAEYSMKSKNLVLNSLYKTKKGKNKSLPTAHDSKNPVIARPERSGVSSSFPSNNISQNDGKNATNIEKKSSIAYNKDKKGERSNEFRRIQEESRRLPSERIQSYRNGSKRLDSRELERLSLVFREEIRADCSSRLLKQQSLVNPKTNKKINYIENIQKDLFHDVFEVARTYLENGELVDLHDNYNNATCYLSENGLSGFAIENDGNLISVFNIGDRGFLDTIKDYVKEKGATHLDGYNSIKQPLMLIYERKLGFKTASIMDYNMEYDHDDIAKNHGKPQVAFMVNTKEAIETKHFNKDQYDEAKEYQMRFALNIQQFSEKDNNTLPTNLVKDHANLKNEKIYSIKTTEGILKNALTNLKDKLPEGAIVKLPGSKKDFVRKSFEEINLSKDIDKTINNLVDTFLGASICINKGQPNEFKGVLKDCVDNSIKSDLTKCFKGLIKHKGDKAYVSKLVEKYTSIFERMNAQIKEQRERGHFAKVYTNLKHCLPKYLRKDLEFTNDNKTYHQMSLLLEPLVLNSNSTNSYYDGGLKNKINELLRNYKPLELKEDGSFEDGFSTYDENIKNEFEVLYEMLPDSYDGKNYSLDSKQLKQVVKLMRMISKTSKDSINKFKKEIGPKATETIVAIETNGKLPLLSKLEARWDVVRSLFGDSSLANDMTNGFRKAVGKAGLKQKGIKDKVSKYIKKNNLDKTLNKEIEFFGAKLPTGSLALTYAQLLTDADFEQINLGGLSYTDDKGKRIVGLPEKTKGKAEDVKQYLEDNLPVEVKDYAKFIKNILNNELKKDYVEYYKIKYGVNDANTLDDYMFLSRQIDKMSSAESMLNAPKLFGNSINRVRKSSEPIKITDLTKSFENYVDNLYQQIYVMPLYRDLLQTLNTKVYYKGNRTNVVGVLKDKYGNKGYEIINNTMNGIAGIKTRQKTILGRLFNGWYKTTLGLKWTTVVKQNFSKLFSNYSFGKITKAELKLVFGSKEFKNVLHEFESSIGEYINRESGSNKINYNEKNNLTTKLDKVTDVFLLGISKMDKATIRTGLAASIISEMDRGVDPTSDDFAQNVVDDFTEFVLTQINSDVLGQNEFGSSKIGELFVFQGPARVALSTFNYKIRMYKKYNKMSEQEIEENILKAKAEEESSQKKHDRIEEELNEEIEKFDERKEEIKKDKSLSKEEKEEKINEAQKDVNNKQEEFFKAEDDLREKKANSNKANNDKKNYRRYKNMGGKKIPIDIAISALLMGIGLTAVSELDQRLKGRKKWDEFDGQDITKQTAYNSLLSWIPVVNTLANSIMNGYDVSLPSASIINEVTETLSSIYSIITKGDFSESNLKTLLRNSISGLSNMTGIPFKTMYDYVVAAIEMFDPEMALRIKNIFYTVSYSGSQKAYSEYVSKNWKGKAIAQLLYNSQKFKGSVIDDNIANEIYVLSRNGYNAIPKNLMTSYIDLKGKEIKLTKVQSTQFANAYRESKKEINNLLKITEYRNLSYEERAKLIKKIYDAYYEYAKCKALKTNSSNRIVKLIDQYNGRIGISKLLIGVNALSEITATKTKTRKEQALEKINKMKGYSKVEKLLIVYLAGFTLSEENSNALKSHTFVN